MKNYSVVALTLLASLLSIFISCKKDDAQPQTCAQTVASIAASYKLTSQRYKPSGGVESEIINTLNACEKDNLLVLNSNTTFVHQDAGVVCTPSQNYAGDWSVAGGNLVLETITYTINSFNCTDLVFYRNDFPNAGDRTTYTYRKQ